MSLPSPRQRRVIRTAALYPEDLFLARHGETEWNTQGRRQGQLDSPLTAKGHSDTQRLITTLGPVGIDAVFTSPLGRAIATATPVAKELDLPVHVIEGLAELDHGTFAGLTNSEVETLHPGELTRRNQHKFDWQYPGGESYRSAEGRASRSLEQIAKTGTHRPFVVAHEMIGRMLAKCLTSMTAQEALEWRLPHGAVVRFEAGSQSFVE